MIPSLKQILAGYRDGSYSEAQCIAWIEEHIRLAVNEARDLDAER